MEYFKIVEVSSTEEEIHQQLSLANLEFFCESIFPMDNGKDICSIGGMWGDFTLRRDQIMGGVRFSMLDCPNALAWTITTGYPPARERKQEEFVEEIQLFLEDFQEGLYSFLS